jgi:hypothetical protein
MSDAETADSRLEAVPDRECERHPSADPEDQEPAGDPAHASESDATLAGAEMGGEPCGVHKLDFRCKRADS